MRWKKGAAAVSLLLAAGAVWAAGEADGVIVKLRDAPSHAEVAQEKAQSSDHRSERGEALEQKLQRVLREAAVDRPAIDVPSTAKTRPTGRDAQVVHYDRLLSKEEAERLAKRLRARSDVEWAVPNTLEKRQQSATDTVPTDPLFAGLNQQWWLLPVQGTNSNDVTARLRGVPGFQTAWGQHGNGIGLAAAPVAVVDTGITAHTDLSSVSPRLLPGYDFITDASSAGDGDARDTDPIDTGDFCGTEESSWHGTRIAGLIAAQTSNGVGVAAIHWQGSILPVRVAGRCGALLSDLIDGLRWAAGLTVTGVPNNLNPARIINISFGNTLPCDSAYQSAINEVRALNGGKGAVVIAAAGNEHAAPTRPANCDNVIGVAALNRDGFKATYSNFGSKLAISTVGGDRADLGAWGSALESQGHISLADTGLLTLSNSGSTTIGSPIYESAFGTSFAAPLVSGTVSLMLGLNPNLTPDDILKGLQLSARKHVTSAYIQACSDSNPGRCICSTSTCGAGILDADQALAFATSPSTYTRPASLDTVVSVDSSDVITAVQTTSQDLPANTVTTTPTTPAGPCGRDGVCAGAVQPAWLLGLLAASAALLWGGRRMGRAVRKG